ncbi:hypothetical protein GLOIN_2v1487752 [Rhizophagus clarus]|uniref:Uncharacterized protein n=1 Tax=Rhizophagus clarus TaxID=94130 RepID=A0A8H3LT49_9GLOM|nr:hypothetical protein GLOIN_2v1487752 [Rhizophagus clarus]
MTKFKDNVPNLNHVYLSKWLIYYYEAWTKTKLRSILREFESYRKGLYPFDEQTINQFENNILSYWELHKAKENIAEPIIPNDEENLNLKTENKNQNSDNEKVAEEQAETESDLKIDNDIEINDFLLNKTHSALNNNAKWDIENIFIDNLNAPFLTDENILN